MQMVGTGKGDRDGSAFLAIDCCPLAQLNETLHLYDKQLHLIQPLVYCCPSILLSFRDVATLSVIYILGFSFQHNFFPSRGRIENIKKHQMQNLSSNWHHVASTHTSGMFFFFFFWGFYSFNRWSLRTTVVWCTYCDMTF